MFMTEIQLPFATVHYDAPVVYFVYKDGAELGFPEIKEAIAISEKLSGGMPYVTFSDVRADVNITDQGRKYVADHNNMPLFRGSAILVTSTLYSFAVNFISHFRSAKYPFRAFVTEEKALEWLMSLPLDEQP
jgi:hypothetical protein